MDFIRRILSRGSQTAPKLIDDVVESKALQQKLAEEAADEGVEVLGKGTSRAAKEAIDPIDAHWRDVVPEPKKISTLDAAVEFAKNNKGKIAGGLTIAELARQMINGSDRPTPLVPKSHPVNEVEPQIEQPIEESKSTVPTEAPEKDGLAPDAEVKESPIEIASPTRLDLRKILEEGISARDRGINDANFNRAAELLAAGLGRIDPDHGTSNILRKQAEKHLEDAKSRIGTEKEQLDYNKMQDSLNDEQAMRDPNSPISKMVTGIAQKVGLLKPGQTASAMALKNSGVNLGTLLSTIEAGNARRDAAALSRENRMDDKRQAQEFRAAEDQKKREDKRKLTTEEVEDRRRNIHDNVEELKKMIGESGTFETFGPHNENMNRLIDNIAVDMAKLADPASVARPAEVEMYKRGLIPSGSKALGMRNSTAEEILSKFDKEVDTRARNAYKVRGVEEPMKAEGNNNSDRTLVNKQYSPSRNQTKFIYSDGTEEIKDGKQ